MSIDERQSPPKMTDASVGYGLRAKEHRNRSWAASASYGIAGTLAGVGAAPFVWGPGLLPEIAAGTLGIAGTSALVTRSVRNERRREIAGEARLAVERVTGPLQRWSCSRWGGWFVGSPARITLRYHPAGVLKEPTWPAPGIKIVEHLFGAHYEVARHDAPRGRLQLRKTAPPEQAEQERQHEREIEIMAQLFGRDATIKPTTADDGSLAALHVAHTSAIKATLPQWRTRVEKAVSEMFPGRWRARWDLHGDEVTFELRPTLPKKVNRPKPVTDPHDPLYWLIPLGVDEDGRPLYWDLKSSMPHFMAIGKTGKGKTNVLRGVAYELAIRDFKVWAGDPKRIELINLRQVPNVQMVCTQVEDMVAMVMQAWEEMERRYALIEAGQATTKDFEKLFIIIDEYAEFATRVAAWYARIRITTGAKDPSTCPVFEKFDSIVRLCRKANMHVIIGLQRCDAKFFNGGEGRDNFDARMSLGRLSSDGSLMMWDSMIGTSLPQVRGRAIACASDDDIREVQTYYMPEPDDTHDDQARALLDAFTPRAATHPDLRVCIPMADEDDKGNERIWDAICEASLIERRPEDPDDEPTLEIPVEDDTAESDDDEYDPPTTVSPDQIRAGDLLQHDEHGWVVVESSEPDDFDENSVAISWRSDDDESSLQLVATDETVTVRHHVSYDDEQEQ